MKPKDFLDLFSTSLFDFSALTSSGENNVPREEVQTIVEDIFYQHAFEINDERSRGHLSRAIYYALKHLDIQFVRDITTPKEVDRGGISFDLFFKGGKIINITSLQ